MTHAGLLKRFANNGSTEAFRELVTWRTIIRRPTRDRGYRPLSFSPIARVTVPCHPPTTLKRL